jgi:hypothetical protein
LHEQPQKLLELSPVVAHRIPESSLCGIRPRPVLILIALITALITAVIKDERFDSIRWCA